MPIEVGVIRRNSIGAVQNGEKIRKEVDEHQRSVRVKPARFCSPNKWPEDSPAGRWLQGQKYTSVGKCTQEFMS